MRSYLCIQRDVCRLLTHLYLLETSRVRERKRRTRGATDRVTRPSQISLRQREGKGPNRNTAGSTRESSTSLHLPQSRFSQLRCSLSRPLFIPSLAFRIFSFLLLDLLSSASPSGTAPTAVTAVLTPSSLPCPLHTPRYSMSRSHRSLSFPHIWVCLPTLFPLSYLSFERDLPSNTQAEPVC